MEVSSGRLGEASDTDDIPLSSDLGSPSLWPNWILSLSPPLPKDGIAAMAVSQADDPLDLDFKLNTNTNFEDLLLYSESAGLSPSSDWVLSLPDLDKVCSASGLDGLEDIAALFVSTCRFCGLVGCRTTILKEAARKIKITSRCPRVHRFSFAHALKPTNNQPSTSVPITCKLCEVEEETRCQPTYWKYALFAHIKQTHPQYWNNAENIPRNLPSYLVEKLTVTSEELALVHAKKMFSGPPIDPICRVDVLGTLPASLAKKPHMTK
ncbi:hypothetical protein BDN71DRAFT_494100 [Pleurotus eryngii]|uniref:Uncharacterized protein n=1 Tax=Pleurotus eryngii TaxID=5323 RepID=A0A9P6A8E9_PLEER|nr:hypothetical protein BDN71DRAFT_494100 [Pleurotus eryngii]